MVRLCLKADPFEAQRYESVRDDVERWVKALKDRGYEVSAEHVYSAWRRHSETTSVGWFAPYGNDERDCAALLAELEPCKIA